MQNRKQENSRSVETNLKEEMKDIKKEMREMKYMKDEMKEIRSLLQLLINKSTDDQTFLEQKSPK